MEKKEEKKVRFSTLVVDGGIYKTQLTNKYTKRKKYEEHNPKLVKAFLPGTIVEIMVKPKKKIISGEPLLILEAMKMKNSIVAHIDGKVLKVNVKKGQLVSKNQVLVELE
jgi:biotin carboxyl carrier protein